MGIKEGNKIPTFKEQFILTQSLVKVTGISGKILISTFSKQKFNFKIVFWLLYLTVFSLE